MVFRCTLSGSDADRWLEVPAWMFEPAKCAKEAAVSVAPYVDLAALSALAALLRDVLLKQMTPDQITMAQRLAQKWLVAHPNSNVGR